jgi:hypothetical protein
VNIVRGARGLFTRRRLICAALVCCAAMAQAPVMASASTGPLFVAGPAIESGIVLQGVAVGQTVGVTGDAAFVLACAAQPTAPLADLTVECSLRSGGNIYAITTGSSPAPGLLAPAVAVGTPFVKPQDYQVCVRATYTIGTSTYTVPLVCSA